MRELKEHFQKTVVNLSYKWYNKLADIFCYARKISCLKTEKGDDYMYSAIEIAKYITGKCTNENSPISNLQLQKILYYIQAHFLKNGEPLFGDSFEAWQYGPVIPMVYNLYCGYGGSDIIETNNSSNIRAGDRRQIDSIVEAKRELFPWDLVAETHHIGGAWDSTYRGGAGNHSIINNELIRKDNLEG